MSAKVSILGLGIMGTAMARSAARGGLNTTVWNRSPAPASDFASANIRMAESAIDAVGGAVCCRHHGVNCRGGVKRHERAASFSGHEAGRSMDTDVNHWSRGHGDEPGAWPKRDPTLSLWMLLFRAARPRRRKIRVILASGDQTRTGAPVQQFFDAIGTKTHWLGRVGQGTRMKLMFNAWIGVLNEGVAEVSLLGDALGIDQGQFASLVTGGPLVPSWAVAKLQKIEEGRTAEPEFPLRWAHRTLSWRSPRQEG